MRETAVPVNYRACDELCAQWLTASIYEF